MTQNSNGDQSKSELTMKLGPEGGADIELSGVVRKLKDGYGFIAGNDGKDYFFHWSAMQKHTKDFRELEVGDRVEFLATATNKGPRAIEILVTG